MYTRFSFSSFVFKLSVSLDFYEGTTQGKKNLKLFFLFFFFVFA